MILRILAGLSDHSEDSDNSAFQYSDITNGRNVHLLGGDSDSESSWQGGNSERNIFCVRIPWVSLGVLKDSH